jgi:hypothetical protein
MDKDEKEYERKRLGVVWLPSRMPARKFQNNSKVPTPIGWGLYLEPTYLTRRC